MRKRPPAAACLAVLAALAAGAGAACTADPPFHGASWPAADRLFHADPRWLGADAAFSVELGGGRVLWLFGDTFVATSDRHVRTESRMVRNTVGLQEGADPSTAAMRFFWRDAGDGPGSFLPEDGDTWHWPGHGAMVEGRLVLFWQRVRKTGDGAFGFAAAGTRALVVANPGDPPDAWTWADAPLPAGNGFVLGVATRVDGGFFEAWGEREPGDHALVLARWPVERVRAGDLAAPAWFDGAGWGRTPVVLGDGAPEFSVQPDPRGNGFLMVQSEGFGATTLAVRTAPAFEGPWSEPASVFRPPESDAKDAFVYAGKGHPGLAGADVVVTYAANTFAGFATLLGDERLYFPRFVKLARE